MVTVPPIGHVENGKGGPLTGAGSPRKAGVGPLGDVPFQSCLYASARRLKKLPCATFCGALCCDVVCCGAICAGAFCCEVAAGAVCASVEGAIPDSKRIPTIAATAACHAAGI